MGLAELDLKVGDLETQKQIQHSLGSIVASRGHGIAGDANPDRNAGFLAAGLIAVVIVIIVAIFAQMHVFVIFHLDSDYVNRAEVDLAYHGGHI